MRISLFFFLCFKKLVLLYELCKLCMLYELRILCELYKLYELNKLYKACKLHELCKLNDYFMNHLKSVAID